MNDYRLVYSTDPNLNIRCKKCKELISECICTPEASIPKTFTVTLRIEKAKRGGITVTVISGLPASDSYVQALSKELKQGTGSGGTYKLDETSGSIEIQGDKRETLRELLRRKDIQVKG